MKNKNEKILLAIIPKIAKTALINIVLDPSTYENTKFYKKYAITKKNITRCDGLIDIDIKFHYDDFSEHTNYNIEAIVTVKGYKFLSFELRFNQNKEKNQITLYDFIVDNKMIDDSNYGLIDNVISYSKCSYNYKRWLNVKPPMWFIEEIDDMYQEQIGRLNNTFKKNRIEQFIDIRDVRYVEITDKHKNVLYLLGNVISDLYQEELGQAEVLTKQDQKKCLELLKNVILPIIGEERDEKELDSIVKESTEYVNQVIKSSGKTLLLEDKNG